LPFVGPAEKGGGRKEGQTCPNTAQRGIEEKQLRQNNKTFKMLSQVAHSFLVSKSSENGIAVRGNMP
jgi:hypothetical protein